MSSLVMLPILEEDDDANCDGDPSGEAEGDGEDVDPRFHRRRLVERRVCVVVVVDEDRGLLADIGSCGVELEELLGFFLGHALVNKALYGFGA